MLPTYLHDRPDWPHFVWDQGTLLEPLAALASRRAGLSGRMRSLGLGARDEAALRTLTLDVLSSSEIEGERLNPAQVRSSIARRLGIATAGMVRSGKRVDGVVELMVDATHHHEAALTPARLFAWHTALFSEGQTTLRVGIWRTDPVQLVSGAFGHEVVHFEGPGPERVAEEMAQFCQWFNASRQLDGVVCSALAHLWFVTVHPFEDGNGRIARAIADMALARQEREASRFYSMSAQILKRRKEYYLELQRAQRGGLDVTPWIVWFVDRLDDALTEVDGTLHAILRKARFWADHGGIALNPRQIKMLNAILDNTVDVVTSSKWARMTQSSHDTALRDIQALVQQGMMVEGPAKGRSTRYELVEPSGKL